MKADQIALTNEVLEKAGVITPSPDAPTGTPSAASGFDPWVIINKLDLWWMKQKYYYRREGDGGFSELSQGEVTRILEVDFSLNRETQIKGILNVVLKDRYLAGVADVAGNRAGIQNIGGKRLLIASSPKLIEPADGECETILSFLTALLGEDGSLRFRLWLKFGYEALREPRHRPGQCLVLAGPSGKGKGVLQSHLITPILAGREADPKAWLFGGEKFNEELIASEHLKMEEMPSSVAYENRLMLAERMKEMSVNTTQRLRGMHKSALTVKPQWRVSMSLNDEPDRLKVLPPLTPDFRDKLLLLKTSSENFCARFANDNADGFEIFLRIAEREMPAFAAHLLALECPKSHRDHRYGVRSFVDPTIEEMLFDQEPESIMLTLIDEYLFPSSLDFQEDGSGELNPWKGSATELREKLIDEGSKGHKTARKLLDGAAEVCGRLLGRLAKKFPDRFSEHRTGKKRSWVIQPPSD